MPYNETPTQAELYYEMANMTDLIKKIDAIRSQIG